MTPKEKEIFEILKDAMNKNNVVTFIYNNELKIVEPYLIGELYDKFENHLTEGEWALRAWFLSGVTSQQIDKKEGDRWRLFKLSDINNLSLLPSNIFFFRPLYNKYDKAFKRISFCF